MSGAPLPPLALPAPNVQNTTTAPIVSSTMKRRLAMFTPLGTPTSQLSVGNAFTGVRAAFGALARVAPRHQVLLPFEERIEVGVGGGDERVARIALLAGIVSHFSVDDHFRVLVGVEQPVTGRRPQDFDFGNLVVVDAQARAEDVRLCPCR